MQRKSKRSSSPPGPVLIGLIDALTANTYRWLDKKVKMNPAIVDLLVTVMQIFIAFGILNLISTLVLLAIFDGKLAQHAPDNG